MLDGLSGGEHASITDRVRLGFLYDLLGFFNDAFYGRTLLAPSRLAQHLKDFFQSRDLTLRLLEVSRKRGGQILRRRLLGHFRKGLQNSLFCIQNVFQGFFEQVLERFH